MAGGERAAGAGGHHQGLLGHRGQRPAEGVGRREGDQQQEQEGHVRGARLRQHLRSEISLQQANIVTFLILPIADDIRIAGDGGNYDTEEGEEDTDTELDSSLPYVNPRTHPLFQEPGSCTELNQTDPGSLDLADPATLASYDPLQKWRTLHNLVNGNEDSSDNNVIVRDLKEDLNVATNDNATASPDKVRRSLSVDNDNEKDVNKNAFISEHKSSTLPSKLQDLKDDLDELLEVERRFQDHEKVYHTVHGSSTQSTNERPGLGHVIPQLTNDNNQSESSSNHNPSLDKTSSPDNTKATKSVVEESTSGKKFTVEKLPDPETEVDGDAPSDGGKVRSKGPRALRRRHGKRMDKRRLRRRSSINGHWYDRDTSGECQVFLET